MDWSLITRGGERFAKEGVACVSAANECRREHPALRRGSSKTLHKDHENGVLAVERHDQETGERLIVVVNNGDGQWDAESPYSIHVGNRWENAEGFEEMYNSQDEAFGGWAKSGNAERARWWSRTGTCFPSPSPNSASSSSSRETRRRRIPTPCSRNSPRNQPRPSPRCSVERVKAGEEGVNETETPRRPRR